jgi:hypothetical protein
MTDKLVLSAMISRATRYVCDGINISLFKSILYSRIFCERTIVAVFFYAKHKAGSIENCLII